MYIVITTALVAALATYALRLRLDLRRAYTDSTYGVLSRTGVDYYARRLRRPFDVVFLDIDAMHEANARWGYAEVDARIRASLVVRSGDVLLAGRWYSGDEIIMVVPRGQGQGAAQRLQECLIAHGLSATFGVEPGTSVHEAVRAASAKVQAAKAEGRRGHVYA